VAAAEDRFELHVDGDPDALPAIRMFVRAVARSIDADAERVDDVQLIVSEICSELLESGGRELHVTVETAPAALDVAVDGAGAVITADAAENGFRRELLKSLSPDTEWSDSGARFRVMMPAASGDHER
jgi:anti-sigma regulatory factor (Ser/Thr protein kinase)